MSFFYIVGTVILTSYGQLVLKWRLSRAGALPGPLGSKVVFLLSQLKDIWVLSCFAAAGIAALCWMAALTRFQLSYAYPFMSLSFVLVLVLGIAVLGERATVLRIVGMVFILAGICIGSRG